MFYANVFNETRNSRKPVFYNFAKSKSRDTKAKSFASLFADRMTIEREKQNEDVESRESLRHDPEHTERINPR